jgi:hypothetical protein
MRLALTAPCRSQYVSTGYRLTRLILHKAEQGPVSELAKSFGVYQARDCASGRGQVQRRTDDHHGCLACR